MDPFDDRDTISVPVEVGMRRGPVVGLRVHGTQKEIELPGRTRRFVIGSAAGCDVVLDDPYVSGVHCVLERRGPVELEVRDQESKNGTYLNGNRVLVATLGPGGLVTVGKTTLVALGRETRGKLTAFEQLVGEDDEFRRAVATAVRAAASECSVLIVGETGTGKELVARAIHEASPRAAGPFVGINCGAIPGELIGSELFGHEKGAFTGALKQRDGVFVHADGGTLFLDELAELPMEHQPHLLRALETRTVRRVGGDLDLSFDTRIVAATNRSHDIGTETSPLRLDVYHRVATVLVQLPPLRARRGDIPLLARAFLDQLASTFGARTISRTTMRMLTNHAWPGNVRELRASIHRAVALCPYELTPETLLQRTPTPLVRTSVMRTRRGRSPTAPLARSRGSDDTEAEGVGLNQLEQTVRDLMLDALERHGSIRRAANELGIPKSTFADRAKRFGIVTSK